MSQNGVHFTSEQETKLDGLPILLRRRLSAPETIMRKHVLAHQFSESSETDTSLSSSSIVQQRRSYWNRNLVTGSENNLSRKHGKHNSNQIRKTTLMKRLAGTTSPTSPATITTTTQDDGASTQRVTLSRNADANIESVPSSSTFKTDVLQESIVSTYSETISSGSSTKSIFYTSTDIRTSSSPKIGNDETYSSSSVLVSTANGNCHRSDSTRTNTHLSDRSNGGFSYENDRNNNNAARIQTGIEHLTFNERPDTFNTFKTNDDTEREKRSFYLNQKKEENEDDITADHKRIMKYMISHVGTGSPYTKPAELTQLIVPRYSALPRTISMEVNTSSAESAAESDTGSLVDSLDDPNSPRQSAGTRRNRNKDRHLSLLPDNSTKRNRNRTNNNKGDAFFIPMRDRDGQDDPSEEDRVKTVAEHMPDRVRERLTKRLQKMERKKIIKNHSAVSNQTVTHHHSPDIVSCRGESSDLGATKKIINQKRDKKPLKIIHDHDQNINRKTLSRKKIYLDANTSALESAVPKRIYRKTELVANPTKRIEILEIMEECVDATTKTPANLKFRSRIPVLANSNNNNNKPVVHLPIVPYTYRRLDDDPKVDQLIANLLIDALNKSDMQMTFESRDVDKITQTKTITKTKRRQKFDAIPEEKQLFLEERDKIESRLEQPNEFVTKNKTFSSDAAIQTDFDMPTRFSGIRNKPALAMMKEEDFSSIPKGWITFYMLRKNQLSPDSSDDEGSVQLSNRDNVRVEPDRVNASHLTEVDDVFAENVSRSDNHNIVLSKNERFGSSSESFTNADNESDRQTLCPVLPIPCLTARHRRQSHKRSRYKKNPAQMQNTNSQSELLGSWSVTVSGSNSCGQPAPDLEMRLKFPNRQTNSQSDSGLGEEQPQKSKRENENESFHLPPTKPVQIKKYTLINRKHKADATGGNKHFQHLPDLMKTKNSSKLISKRRESSVPAKCQTSAIPQMPPLKTKEGTVGPRQTLTSYRRFSLHHSPHLSPHLRTMFPNITDSDMMRLPECFPGILAVMGSAITPENKPNILTITNRIGNRNHLSIGNQQ